MQCHVKLSGLVNEIRKLSSDASEARLDALRNETIGAIADAQEHLESAALTLQDAVDGERNEARGKVPAPRVISSAELIAKTDTPGIRGAVAPEGGGRHT